VWAWVWAWAWVWVGRLAVTYVGSAHDLTG